MTINETDRATYLTAFLVLLGKKCFNEVSSYSRTSIQKNMYNEGPRD